MNLLFQLSISLRRHDYILKSPVIPLFPTQLCNTRLQQQLITINELSLFTLERRAPVTPHLLAWKGKNQHTSPEVKESSPSAARTLISPPCAVTPLKNSFQKSLLLLVTNTILKGKYPESSNKAKSMCHKEESKNRTLQPKSHAFICNKLKRKMASRPKITNFFLNPLLISNSDCSALLHFITFPVTVSSLGNYHSPPRAMLFPTCQLLPLPPVITTLIPVLQLSAELVRKSGKDDLDIKAADHAEKLLGEKVTPHFLQENFKQVGVF